ncbi:MAG: GNAT family N-acetyltransferase, partial [Pseudomonadota bacterium]
DLVRVYGPVQALWRGAILEQFERKLRPGILQMDGIFVRETARGQGVGSALLEAVVWTARMNRCDAVRLDVIDTNPRARQLYERQGFRAVGEVRAGLLAPVLGFRTATIMELPVAEVPA